MIDKNKQQFIARRFKQLVFDRFGIKDKDVDGQLLKWCIEISDRWASTRFDCEDKWHVRVIDIIINSRLDTYQPNNKATIYGGQKQLVRTS